MLDESLKDIAELLDLTVDAVKAHLARGRARLREINAQAATLAAARPVSAAVARYVTLFNAQNWDGLRALLADDVKLHQSTYPVRVGAADVGMFFTIYAKFEGVRLEPAWVEGREVIAVFEDGADAKAQLLHVARMAGRPHQLHPRLSLCALYRGRREADAGGGWRSCGQQEYPLQSAVGPEQPLGAPADRAAIWREAAAALAAS